MKFKLATVKKGHAVLNFLSNFDAVLYLRVKENGERSSTKKEHSITVADLALDGGAPLFSVGIIVYASCGFSGPGWAGPQSGEIC